MGLYVRCRLPKEAVTIRTKRAVESSKARGAAKRGTVPQGLAR